MSERSELRQALIRMIAESTPTLRVTLANEFLERLDEILSQVEARAREDTIRRVNALRTELLNKDRSRGR